jgi:hypothetical protein
MNWKHFGGACLLGGALAIKAGAPIVAVIAGIVLIGALNRWIHGKGEARGL